MIDFYQRQRASISNASYISRRQVYQIKKHQIIIHTRYILHTFRAQTYLNMQCINYRNDSFRMCKNIWNEIVSWPVSHSIRILKRHWSCSRTFSKCLCHYIAARSEYFHAIYIGHGWVFKMPTLCHTFIFFCFLFTRLAFEQSFPYLNNYQGRQMVFLFSTARKVIFASGPYYNVPYASSWPLYLLLTL